MSFVRRLAVRSCALAAVVLLTMGSAPQAASQEPPRSAAETVTALSFNIRYGTADDGENRWERRRELVLDVIRSGGWDFVGLQEALLFQVDEILAAAPDLAALVRTRDADPAKGESCALLYRRERWRLQRGGTFWLSETPVVAGSRSWDAALPRIATWGFFAEVAGPRRLHVVNTHFDHRGETARERSARLLRRHIAATSDGRPVVLLGDFNSGEGTPPIATLSASVPGTPTLVDSFRAVHPGEGEDATFNDWRGTVRGARIDYVFLSRDLEVIAAAIDRRSRDGRYPSDHYPVSATFR